jgi:sugar transferase (PEP-CTERM/EpsH1 system associated)
VVSPQLPSLSWGAGIRYYYLLRALARKHTVSFLAFNHGDEAEMSRRMSLIKDLAGDVQLVARPVSRFKRLRGVIGLFYGRSYIFNVFIVDEMQDALDAAITNTHYDVVLFEAVSMADYRLPGDVKTIVDQHNNVYELLQRTYQRERAWARKWYNWLESRLIQAAEIERYGRANAVLVTSEREQVTLKRLLPTSVIEVVPNGVDIEHFRAAGGEQEVEHRVVFTGTMDYYPNIDAVLFFARECWPRILAQVPTATWQIVGKNPPKVVRRLEEVPGVTVTGSVVDVRPYLAQAAVAIAPILIGSGTRLKILEAWAMGKAVVSTSIGYEGLEAEVGKQLLVADEAEGLVQAIVELLRNPQQRQVLGAAGRALVEAEYSWERCGRQLLQVLEKVC